MCSERPTVAESDPQPTDGETSPTSEKQARALPLGRELRDLTPRDDNQSNSSISVSSLLPPPQLLSPSPNPSLPPRSPTPPLKT